MGGTHPEVLADAVRATAGTEPEHTRIALGVGVGPAAGHLAGLVRHEGSIRSLAAVRVIAPGLPRLGLARSARQSLPANNERFSRTIGALGEGTFERLRSLNTGAVGLGFTLIEQFLSGSVGDSMWLQGEVTSAGTLQLRSVPLARTLGCPICRWCGYGDEGLLHQDRLAVGAG